MELSKEITIPALMTKVFDSLNGSAILLTCILGCEELVKRGDTEPKDLDVRKIELAKAKFSGQVILNTTQHPK